MSFNIYIQVHMTLKLWVGDQAATEPNELLIECNRMTSWNNNSDSKYMFAWNFLDYTMIEPQPTFWSVKPHFMVGDSIKPQKIY